MFMDLQDLERLQKLYPEYQVELIADKLILTAPSDIVSGAMGVRFSSVLADWVYEHKLGHVFATRTGFHLSSGDLLSPRVSFVSRTRLKRSTRSYLAVVPELIVEIKSRSDRVRGIEEKISLFLAQGVQVGILIDPDKKVVSIYRNAGTTTDDGEETVLQKTTLQNDDILAIPELFPGWEIAISRF